MLAIRTLDSKVLGQVSAYIRVLALTSPSAMVQGLRDAPLADILLFPYARRTIQTIMERSQLLQMLNRQKLTENIKSVGGRRITISR